MLTVIQIGHSEDDSVFLFRLQRVVQFFISGLDPLLQATAFRFLFLSGVIESDIKLWFFFNIKGLLKSFCRVISMISNLLNAL